MSDLEDMTADDNAAFETMRNETGAGKTPPARTGGEGANEPEPQPGNQGEQHEPDPEGTQLIKGQKMVPVSALIGERSKWKERYGELEGRYNKGEERLNKLFERIGQPAPAAAGQPGANGDGGQSEKDDGSFKPTVKEEDDPIEYYKQRSAWLEGKVAKIEKGFTDHSQRTEAERQHIQVMTHVASDEKAYSEKQADYFPAVNYFVQQRRAQLEMLGLNEQQVGQQLIAERNQLVATALQNKKSPAEMAYKLAQSFGWRPEMAAGKGGASGGGKDLKQVEQTQAAARSLSNARGGSAQVQIDMAALASMSDEEFDRLTSAPGAWEQLNKTGYLPRH